MRSVQRGTPRTRRTLIAAHRGGAGLWPENSLTAFRNAVRLPIDLIEFDVHRTADGVLVVIHDASLDRTTTGKGAVAALTRTDLRGIRLKGLPGEAIPQLDQVIGVAEPTLVDMRLEFKRRSDGTRYRDIEKQVITSLRNAGMLARTIFSSYDWRILATALDLASPRDAVGLARIKDDTTQVALAAKCYEARTMGLGEIALPMAQITVDRLDLVQSFGLRCGAYRAHTKSLIKDAFVKGLSAITTDRPDWAIDLRGTED